MKLKKIVAAVRLFSGIPSRSMIARSHILQHIFKDPPFVPVKFDQRAEAVRQLSTCVPLGQYLSVWNPKPCDCFDDYIVANNGGWSKRDTPAIILELLEDKFGSFSPLYSAREMLLEKNKSTDLNFSLSFTLLSHKKIMAHRPGATPGMLRDCVVSWDGVPFEPLEIVESELDQLFKYLDEVLPKVKSREVDPIFVATLVQKWFLTIHPFRDGNSRVVKLISSYIFLVGGLPPIHLEGEFGFLCPNGKFQGSSLREDVQFALDLVQQSYKEFLQSRLALPKAKL